jgi:hypothetical protein
VPRVDDKTIEDREKLLRRVHPKHVVPDDAGGYRVSSAAFGDVDLSVDIRSTVTALGRDLQSCVEGHEGYGLVSITAGLARQQHQSVSREPIPENLAHGIVDGKKTPAVKKAFYSQCAWEIDSRPAD